MALTLSGTDGVVGAGFTLDSSGASVTAGIGTFNNIRLNSDEIVMGNNGQITLSTAAGTEARVNINEGSTTNSLRLFQNAGESCIQCRSSQPLNIKSQAGAGTTSHLALWTRNSEKVRIAADGKVGIGSTIPTTDLDVNGFIKSGAPSFSAKVSGTTTLSTGSETTIIFNSEDHDTDNAYNASTGEFTVPSGKGGKYFIAVNFGIDDCGEVGDILRLRVFKNGSNMQGFRGQNIQASANIILTTSVSGTVTLSAGDVIKCMAYTDSNVGDANIEVECTSFSMFRLSI